MQNMRRRFRLRLLLLHIGAALLPVGLERGTVGPGVAVVTSDHKILVDTGSETRRQDVQMGDLGLQIGLPEIALRHGPTEALPHNIGGLLQAVGEVGLHFF